MPANRVLHDLDQRFELAVEGLGRQSRRRIAAAQQRARHGRVESIVETLVHLARGECLEVRALTAGDVDHLDPLTGAHQIGIGRRRLDADVVDRIGERFRQNVQPLARGRCCAGDSQLDGGGRVLFLGRHCRARYGHDQNAVARYLEFSIAAGPAFRAEQPRRACLGKVDAPAAQGANRARRTSAIA